MYSQVIVNVVVKRDEAEVGSAWQEAQKTQERIYVCSEGGGHELGWCERRGWRGHGVGQRLMMWAWPALRVNRRLDYHHCFSGLGGH